MPFETGPGQFLLKEGGGGSEGKGWGMREGSSNCNGGDGGPFKGQFGPDPHRGALDGHSAHIAACGVRL